MYLILIQPCRLARMTILWPSIASFQIFWGTIDQTSKKSLQLLANVSLTTGRGSPAHPWASHSRTLWEKSSKVDQMDSFQGIKEIYTFPWKASLTTMACFFYVWLDRERWCWILVILPCFQWNYHMNSSEKAHAVSSRPFLVVESCKGQSSPKDFMSTPCHSDACHLTSRLSPCCSVNLIARRRAACCAYQTYGI